MPVAYSDFCPLADDVICLNILTGGNQYLGIGKLTLDHQCWNKYLLQKGLYAIPMLWKPVRGQTFYYKNDKVCIAVTRNTNLVIPTCIKFLGGLHLGCQKFSKKDILST